MILNYGLREPQPSDYSMNLETVEKAYPEALEVTSPEALEG